MSKSMHTSVISGDKGFLIKNSVFLPFQMELLSVWIGKDMSLVAKPDLLTDFSSGRGDIQIREEDSYTNLIFIDHKDLKKEYGHYKGHIILYAADKGADIFAEENRHYVKLSFHDDSNNVYMELVDDPFDL